MGQLAQSKRMSIIGEGIECLVTKTLHTHTLDIEILRIDFDTSQILLL